jgi:hypothetical protein
MAFRQAGVGADETNLLTNRERLDGLDDDLNIRVTRQRMCLEHRLKQEVHTVEGDPLSYRSSGALGIGGFTVVTIGGEDCVIPPH